MSAAASAVYSSYRLLEGSGDLSVKLTVPKHAIQKWFDTVGHPPHGGSQWIGVVLLTEEPQGGA
jgi:hypothetical protein